MSRYTSWRKILQTCAGVAGVTTGTYYVYHKYKTKNNFNLTLVTTEVEAKPLFPRKESNPPPSRYQRIYSDTDMSPLRDEDDDQPKLEDLELLHVQILFRHGARTPLKKIENFTEVEWDEKLLDAVPHATIPFTVLDRQGNVRPVDGPHEARYKRIMFPGGAHAGQLTVIGQQQMFELGRKLRDEYITNHDGFLSGSFKKHEVYVQSTNIKRTILSARSLLAGMYQTGKKWRGEKVVILTEDPDEEILYPNTTYCLQLKQFTRRVFRERLFDTIPGLKQDREKIENMMGTHRPITFTTLMDNLTCRKFHNLYIPSELEGWQEISAHYATMTHARILTCGDVNLAGNCDRRILQLTIGPLLSQLKRNIHKSLNHFNNDEDYYKLELYSCHDSTLLPLLVVLGVHDGKWPPYCADLRIETFVDKHRGIDEGEAWVKVKYLGKAQRVPGCFGEYCTLDEFLSIVAPYAVSRNRHQDLCSKIRRTSDSPKRPSEQQHEQPKVGEIKQGTPPSSPQAANPPQSSGPKSVAPEVSTAQDGDPPPIGL